jgi:hypothetical protein
MFWAEAAALLGKPGPPKKPLSRHSVYRFLARKALSGRDQKRRDAEEFGYARVTSLRVAHACGRE